jgi:hypothetical protein
MPTKHIAALLSYRQPPHPDLEVATHVRRCAREGSTFVATVATPVQVRDLWPGQSVVVFFGNRRNQHGRLLAQGTFRSYVNKREEPGRFSTITSNYQDLYGNGVINNYPAFLEVSELRETNGGHLDDMIREGEKYIPSGTGSIILWWSDSPPPATPSEYDELPSEEDDDS